MATRANSRWIRPRQRSRTSLPAFTSDLTPSLAEIGVDRFQFGLSGRWRCGPDTALEDFWALVGDRPNISDWFAAPEISPKQIVIRTRTSPAATIRDLSICWRRVGRADGIVSIKLSANPTRTLHHLLARPWEEGDWAQSVANMPPEVFFANAEGISRGLDHNDNWLPDLDLAHARVGEDIFSGFLPTYARQLMQLVLSLVKPRPTFRREDVATVVSLREGSTLIDFDWRDARVPQIETYFERHHSTAQQAVQRAALTAITELDSVLVTRYPEMASEWIERKGDCLSVKARGVSGGREVMIYAKHVARIRFEIKRLKSGKYPQGMRAACGAPLDCLLAILAHERAHLLDAVRWQAIGAMFDERPTPGPADFAQFCATVSEACRAEGATFSEVLRHFMVDGGIARSGQAGMTSRLVARLCNAGILQRVTVRGGRDATCHGERVSLLPEIRAMIEAVRAALGPETLS